MTYFFINSNRWGFIASPMPVSERIKPESDRRPTFEPVNARRVRLSVWRKEEK